MTYFTDHDAVAPATTAATATAAPLAFTLPAAWLPAVLIDDTSALTAPHVQAFSCWLSDTYGEFGDYTVTYIANRTTLESDHDAADYGIGKCQCRVVELTFTEGYAQ